MMRLDDTIVKYGMLRGAKRVLCALSGGSDSCALTHYLASHAEKLGITVAAAHFSHGIRKDAAESERELCCRLCDSLGIELYLGQGDSLEYAAQNKIGLEEAARKLRYSFLEDVADKWNADKIATAHHADDNEETLIMNACRGAGFAGLAGIPPVREKYIRPLIETRKKDIFTYIEQNGIIYADDETNFEPCCFRNRVRLNLLPELRRVFPQTDNLLIRFIRMAYLKNDETDCKAEILFSDCEITDEHVQIVSKKLLQVEQAVAARTIELMYRRAGGTSMLNTRHIRSVLDVAAKDAPSASIDLPRMKVCRIYDKLVFRTDVSNCGFLPTIINMGQKVVIGEWETELIEGKHDGAYIFDVKKLSFPLILRPRQEGDRILWGEHHKTLKKIMIERKIPKEMRDFLPVLTDNNRVLAVACIGCDISMQPDTDKNAISVVFRRIKR